MVPWFGANLNSLGVAPKTLVHSYSVPELQAGRVWCGYNEEYPWETSGLRLMVSEGTEARWRRASCVGLRDGDFRDTEGFSAVATYGDGKVILVTV